MAHPNEPPSNHEDVKREVIQRVWQHCHDNRLTSADVVQILLMAAGAYGWTLPDKNILLREINKFINATRVIYPDFVLDNPGEYGHYLAYQRNAALEEKRWHSVH